MSTTPRLPGRPLVSVIIPCRNGMPFVRHAVERVLAQKAPLELLFVNVDSSDRSLQEVSAIDDDRIRVIEAPTGTAPGPARHLAASRAQGDVLAFADADDLWRPDKLERQLRLRSETGAALVYSDCRVIDGAGRVPGAYLSRHRPKEGTITKRLLKENFVRLSTVLVDRAAFECLGGFHEDFHVACDYLFAIRLSLSASFALDPEALVDYRIHDRTLTVDFQRTYAENVRVFDLLLADEAASLGATHLRRARSLVLWRWTIREGMAGPANWTEACRRAGQAVRSAGLVTGVGTLAAALRGGLRNLLLRMRMDRARGTLVQAPSLRALTAAA